MIERYARPEMSSVWADENRFEYMRMVEVAVAQSQAELKMIPKVAATQIASVKTLDSKAILKIEAKTHHDVIAFVQHFASKVGPHGRFIHYGLTSSDVIDTAFSLRVRAADKILQNSLKELSKSLKKQIKKHKETLCAGRTHGMHAEPTTLGYKLLGFLAELDRNQKRYNEAVSQMMVGKLSGAVGTYSAQKSAAVEKKVCSRLKLTPETVATQVIPRDRHAQLAQALCLLGCGLERLSVELRHLQRTEVGEVCEGFVAGQKGSSAMPHKKNPISSENLTGAARMLRGYTQAIVENISLWHERDISHSSVERVCFADSYILCDYAIDRMARVMNNIVVNKDKMKQNMDASQGQLYSSQVLSLLVEAGLQREKAYNIIQECSHNLKHNEHLKDQLKQHPEVKKALSDKVLDQCFSGTLRAKAISQLVDKTLKSLESHR